MKKGIFFLIISGIFVFISSERIYAQVDVKKNTVEEQRLEKRFNVTNAQIESLRNQKLGFGEMDHVFSLAKQMPGGINDQNVQKIMALREEGGHTQGWGKVAQDLNLKMGKVTSDVNRDVNRVNSDLNDHSARAVEKIQERSQAIGSGLQGSVGMQGSGGMGHHR